MMQQQTEQNQQDTMYFYVLSPPFIAFHCLQKILKHAQKIGGYPSIAALKIYDNRTYNLKTSRQEGVWLASISKSEIGNWKSDAL